MPTSINDQRISPIRPLHLIDKNARGGDHSERFSRKVFVGGLPPDIDEGITAILKIRYVVKPFKFALPE